MRRKWDHSQCLFPCPCASQAFVVTFVGTGRFQSSWLVSSGLNWVSWQKHCPSKYEGQWVWALNENVVVGVNPVTDEGIVSQTCYGKVGKGWLYLIICTWFWTAEGESRKDLKAVFGHPCGSGGRRWSWTQWPSILWMLCAGLCLGGTCVVSLLR